MRLVLRRLFPSTSALTIWTRFAVLSLFILNIMLEHWTDINEIIQWCQVGTGHEPDCDVTVWESSSGTASRVGLGGLFSLRNPSPSPCARKGAECDQIRPLARLGARDPRGR